MIIVSDTSPITSLAAIGQLDLLRQLYSKILIPEAVYQELTGTATLVRWFQRGQDIRLLALIGFLGVLLCDFATPVACGGKPSCSAGSPLRETK